MNLTDHLAVTICATRDYQYAMTAQARMIHANLCRTEHPITIILIGDNKLEPISGYYRRLFGTTGKEGRIRVETITNFEARGEDENYKNGAQLLIAQMRTAAFAAARTAGANLCWSLDSDVIPKSSSCYATLRWIIDMPGSYYEVAISPYPSQGGGDLLTGRGTPEHPILQDFGQDERVIPPELQARINANQKAIAELKPPSQPPKTLQDEATEIYKLIDKCMPAGNVFQMNARRWRMRGWLMQAYPGLGRGVIVPSDWCGFGNTLMSRRAMDEADFFGYDGGGTEDLYVVWFKWHQAGIRIGSALHEPSSHVSRRKDKKYFISYPRFVTDADETKGECAGHIRIIQRPFYAHDSGEKFDAENDGNPQTPEERKEAEKKAAEAAEKAKAAAEAEAKKTAAPEPISPPAEPDSAEPKKEGAEESNKKADPPSRSERRAKHRSEDPAPQSPAPEVRKADPPAE